MSVCSTVIEEWGLSIHSIVIEKWGMSIHSTVIEKLGLSVHSSLLEKWGLALEILGLSICFTVLKNWGLSVGSPKNKFSRCVIAPYFFSFLKDHPIQPPDRPIRRLLPCIEGKTALGTSSPAKPALHIPDQSCQNAFWVNYCNLIIRSKCMDSSCLGPTLS